MLYAIEEINNDNVLLPKVSLGYVMKDTCDTASNALTFALEYMLDTAYLYPQPKAWNTSVNGLCINELGVRRLLVGVVGAASSPISAAISTAFSTDFIPQVSYASTSTVFSNRHLYRSFLRTVPSDKYQAQAIAEVLKHFDWTYVTAFASDDEYGRDGLDELRKRSKELDICFATDHLFASPLTDDGGFEDIMDHIQSINTTARVVVLWCPAPDALKIINGANKRGLRGITWIGTETWTTNFRLDSLNIPGFILGLDIYNTPMKKFEEAFYSRKSINCNNPWFVEYLGSTCEEQPGWNFYTEVLPLERYQQVIASVYTLAHGLHKMLNCTATSCVVPNESLDYKTLYNNILNVDFVIPDSKFRVNFDKKGEYLSQLYFYTLVNLNGGERENIGNWTGEGKVYINNSLLNWGTNGQPESFCSVDCQPGFIQKNGSTQCCWSCTECLDNTVSTKTNQRKCKRCLATQLANKNHTQCLQLAEEKLLVDSVLGIVVIVASIIGVSIALFFIIVYIVLWDTPVIKSSSRELSMIQLTSLFILFCLPIIAFFQCNVYLCMARTIIFGFFLSTVISIIVVKTYRLLRVFNGRFSKVSRFLQNQYQVLFVYIFVFAQLVVTVVWYLYQPIKVKYTIDEINMTFHIGCGKSDEIIFFIVLSYIFILTLTSAYMSFRARSLPENFNEAQFIAISMFTVCVIWLMFLPLYFSLVTVSNMVAFLMINFLSALTILLILYTYKVNIVLFHPHLNSPEYFRKTATKATVTNFKKDIIHKDGSTISRMMSVITFEAFDDTPPSRHVPARRYSIGIADRDTPDSYIELKPMEKRRASFSSMNVLNKERIFDDHLTKDQLLEPLNRHIANLKKTNRMKKSLSTPNLLDLLEDKPKIRKTLSPPSTLNRMSLSRSVSNFMHRVASSNSVHSLLNHNDSVKYDNMKDEGQIKMNENDKLIDVENSYL